MRRPTQPCDSAFYSLLLDVRHRIKTWYAPQWSPSLWRRNLNRREDYDTQGTATAIEQIYFRQ